MQFEVSGDSEKLGHAPRLGTRHFAMRHAELRGEVERHRLGDEFVDHGAAT